jgi:hypothetical protein
MREKLASGFPLGCTQSYFTHLDNFKAARKKENIFQ